MRKYHIQHKTFDITGIGLFGEVKGGIKWTSKIIEYDTFSRNPDWQPIWSTMYHGGPKSFRLGYPQYGRNSWFFEHWERTMDEARREAKERALGILYSDRLTPTQKLMRVLGLTEKELYAWMNLAEEPERPEQRADYFWDSLRFSTKESKNNKHNLTA